MSPYVMATKSAPPFVPPNAPALLADLLTYWALNEESGDRLDLHTNGYTLSQVGTLGSGTGLVYPAAAAFDMDADNALTRARADSTLINFSSTTPFTIVVWLNLADNTGGPDSPYYYRSVLNFNGGSYAAGGYTVHTTTGNQLCVMLGKTGGPDGQYTAHLPMFLTLNTWQMFAWTHNAGALTYYLDGAMHTDTNSYSFTASTNRGFYIGIKGGDSYVWDGLIGPVMMFSRALSGTELDWLYNSGAGRTYAALS